MVVSSLLPPYAAIFKAFPATKCTSSSGLSPTAAEFVAPSAYAIATSDLSPHAIPFVSMSTMQAEYDLWPQLTHFVPSSPCEMAPGSGPLPQATSFVPMSPYKMAYESGLSPRAAVFIPTSAEQTSCYGDITRVHPTLPDNYRPGMERIESAIKSCETVLVSQHIDLKQHEDECAHHYKAFLRWKYFERYDEPCQDQDIDSAQYLADARDFRCTKCRDRSLVLKQQFDYTFDKYTRLVAMHGRAAVDFAST
ncbi:hypothetical protein MBLNU13_g10781t2 [Cladosporium sp. NU13]